MAVIAYTATQSVGNPIAGSTTNENGWIVSWGPMANGDTGAPITLAGYADKSIQVEGTFGTGGSATAQGSNNGTNYRALNDPTGTTIAITAAGIKAITEAVVYVQPAVTAGDVSTALTVTMFFRKTAGTTP